jgi:hypothetical protein
MQVHNYGASQTLFAFNSFNNNGTPCIGIGNQPTDHPDWTHNKNAGSYNHRRMHVFVLPGGDGDNTAPTMSRATAAHSLNQVSVQFSEQMADSAGDPAMYAINNGVTITEAILNPNKRVVLLITTPLTAGQSYTLSTDGLRDRSANGNLMQPFATLGFTAPNTPVPALPECLTNVVESSQYRLIHKLAVVAPTYYANGCNYAVDESLFPNSFFDRIAYCMELESGGVYQWVYVSMDAFTADIYKIGVPTADRLTTWQRYVNNMNVYASANAAVTTGVGITTGNIEFWPSNYGGSNRANIPGAQSTFDFGDGDFNTSAGHGSMQIHNYAESQTIMAMNQFGSNNRNPALGIGNNPNLNASNPDPDWTFRSNVGSYSIKNIYVMVRDAAAVQTGTALTIANQPHSQSIRAGESATLSLYSPDAYTYQWRKNGIWISGATSSWLEFTDAAADNSGSYDVIVFATDGSYIISDSATLQVLPTGTTLIVR